MMNKKERSEYLLLSIGEVDDRLLQEAVCYRAEKRQLSFKPYVIGFAACVAIAFALSAILPIIDRLSSLSEDSALGVPPAFNDSHLNGDANINDATSPENPKDEQLDNNEDYDSFEELLFDKKDSADAVLPSHEDIVYGEFTGIVWMYSGESAVYVKELDAVSLESIHKEMGSGKEISESGAEPACKVWIVDEDGIVTTPYLKESIGNTDVAIFDYNAEIIPDEELIELISEILD